MSFTAEERARYARHILLKEIGGPGQQALKAATVAIVGLGGLGAPAALYLAAAGVGRLRLIDDDTVALSNLQRQILYRSADVGAAKVARAEDALHALNANVEIEARTERLHGPAICSPVHGGAVSVRSTMTEGGAAAAPSDRFAATSPASGGGNAIRLLEGATLVLDGTDSFETRFAVNAACHALGVPLISGAVGRWDGQLATFKSGLTKGKPRAERLPCYRCFVPEAPPESEPCSLVGVVGALTGVIGTMMALEAIKEITRAGESLAGRLLIYDALAAEPRVVKLPADPACPVCGDDCKK